MKDFDGILRRLGNEKDPRNGWINKITNRVVSRLILVFIRISCLLRPIGEGGKLKLTADMAALEYIVSPLFPVKECSNYKSLKSLRSLLFKDSNSFLEAPEVKELLPSNVLHLLLSRADNSLLSPHQFKMWSIAQYNDWIEKHSEQEIWMLVKQCLDSYASLIDSRGESNYTLVYPILLKLGQRFSASFQ